MASSLEEHAELIYAIGADYTVTCRGTREPLAAAHWHYQADVAGNRIKRTFDNPVGRHTDACKL